MQALILDFYGPPKPDRFTLIEAHLREEAAKLVEKMRPEMEAALAQGEDPAFLFRQGRDALAPIHAELVYIYSHRPLSPIWVKIEP